MGVWSQDHYNACAREVLDLIKKVQETRKLPAVGDYYYYIVWGGGDSPNCRWVEIPQEVLGDIRDEIQGMDIVKEVREMEVGYNFYESAFIRICV